MFARLGLVLLLFAAAWPAKAEHFLVRDQNEYAHALKQLAAGDVIILANGEWRDFELVITGKGRKDAPITLISEEAGKVFLTGQSSLRIGGEYILVTGLVFKDGYSPRGEVISFRRSKEDQARNSRVTEVVVDNFSKPDRYESDYWVGMYGRGNRFDHNHLVGKTNKGVTLAVRLDTEESRNNHHRIDHNYFGPRPVLGSNGGETLRIGTSKYSMYDSGTIVEHNIFDRTDGEVEIISSKSGKNVFRGNLFLRSRGTLTLRHGDDNLVERNVFLGYGKDYTGGIRVINRNQTVRQNYMEGLRGAGFSSALTVMNGVPNSPVNRYVQVENAVVENNTVIDSARITLGAGADEERSAPPIRTRFADNLLSGLGDETFIEVDADISGISFSGNRLLAGSVHSALSSVESGVADLQRGENGLLYPVEPSLQKVGAPRDLAVLTLEDVGVSWYAKPPSESVFGSSGKVIEVEAGEDTLFAAARMARGGDILMLQPGDYVVNKALPLDKPLTIRGAPSEDGIASAVLLARPTLIELLEGGNIQLQNLVIDGSLAPDSVGNSVIRTGPQPIKSNMLVELSDVTVRNLTVNKSFNVVTLGKSTLADRVLVQKSRFQDITGTIVSAAAESEDFGQYNVEYLELLDNSFENVSGPAAAVYRGGTDESTFGPFVSVRRNRFVNVGKTPSGGFAGALHLHGVQTTDITANTFESSAPLTVVHTVGTPRTTISDNIFSQTPAPNFDELIFGGDPRVTQTGNTFDTENAE